MALSMQHNYIVEIKSVRGYPFWHTREVTLPTHHTLEGAHAAARSALHIPEDRPITFTLFSRLYGVFVEIDKDSWSQIGHGRDIYIIQNPQDQLQTQSPPFFSSNTKQPQQSTSQSSTSSLNTCFAIPFQLVIPPGSLESPASLFDKSTQVIHADSPPRTNLSASVASVPNIPNIVGAENDTRGGIVEVALLEVTASKSKPAWLPAHPLPRPAEGIEPDTSCVQSTGSLDLNFRAPKTGKVDSRQHRAPVGPYQPKDGTNSAPGLKRGRGRPRTRPFGPKNKPGRPKKREMAAALATSSVEVEM